MFEVGKSYTIRMWEDGEDGGVLTDYDNCEVVEISMPLIKFKQPPNEDVIVIFTSVSVSAQKWSYYLSRFGRRTDVKLLVILPVFLVGATLALSVTPAAASWQFVISGPNAERQISPHFETEKDCKIVLKVTAPGLAKKYPNPHPLLL